MNCFDCRFLGAKVGHWYRCHRLPEALSRDKAQKYQLHPDTYHSNSRPCPDFAAKVR